MGSATATLSGFGVFGDDMFTSTDLNRRSAEVLNSARVRPVTISRNNEQFALLRRDQVASLIQAVTTIRTAVELVRDASGVIAGAKPSSCHSWLAVFEKDDLQKLCNEVLTVTSSTAASVMAGERSNWEEVRAVIHEWRESALVAQSGVLDNAMYVEKADESPLSDPREDIEESAAPGDPTCVMD